MSTSMADTDMDTLQSLSSAQCVLLTVHYANEANFAALHAFTPARVDVLSPELVLRIVLSYVPETVDPQLYTTYVREVATRIYLEQLAPYKLDTLPVAGLSPEQAQKRANKLHLAPLTSPVYPGHAPDDLLTRFIVHRAQRIDSETGLLALVPRLVEPFLDSSDFLRTWYITAVLPLLRLRYEYYPGRQDQPILSDFEKLDGQHAIHVLMAHSTEAESPIARDIRAMVGPWMYGHTERKRRRLESNRREINQDTTRSQPRPDGFVKLDGVTQNDKTGHDWERVFEWMLHHAAHDHFPLVTNLIEDWDGPGDVDLGGFQNPEAYLDEELQAKLERQYAQAALSSCYSAEADTSETIDSVHRVLVRLAELLAFEPPPELATSVHQLPKIDQHAELLHAAESTILVKPENLLRPEHPLTTPILETYMLLQMMLYSAYQFAGLGHAISILNVAKLRFFSTEDEQLSLLSKIIHGLTARGKRDDQQWQDDYDKLLWLWDWNVGSEDQGGRGAGIFGKIEKTTIEREMLKVLISNGCKFCRPFWLPRW
jgi:hypothetical protein